MQGGLIGPKGRTPIPMSFGIKAEDMPPSPFRPDLLSDASTADLAAQYQSAAPYKHVCIKSLGTDAAMRGVRQDILHHMSTAYRETDLFKVRSSRPPPHALDPPHPCTRRTRIVLYNSTRATHPPFPPPPPPSARRCRKPWT